jgi:hypothetical protein
LAFFHQTQYLNFFLCQILCKGLCKGLCQIVAV